MYTLFIQRIDAIFTLTYARSYSQEGNINTNKFQLKWDETSEMYVLTSIECAEKKFQQTNKQSDLYNGDSDSEKIILT